MTSNQQRQLAFNEDAANAADQTAGRGKTGQQQIAPQAVERRQSVWNPGPRKSIFIQPAARRLSHSFGSYGSRKSSQELPRIKLQNTYRLEPAEGEKFEAYKLEPKIQELLHDALKDKKYNAKQAAQLSKDISQDILRETRIMCSHRYKIIAHVLIGEMLGQDIRFGSRCLWDTNYDNLANIVYKNSSLYAIATIFGIYFD